MNHKTPENAATGKHSGETSVVGELVGLLGHWNNLLFQVSDYRLFETNMTVMTGSW